MVEQLPQSASAYDEVLCVRVDVDRLKKGYSFEVRGPRGGMRRYFAGSSDLAFAEAFAWASRMDKRGRIEGMFRSVCAELEGSAV